MFQYILFTIAFLSLTSTSQKDEGYKKISSQEFPTVTIKKIPVKTDTELYMESIGLVLIKESIPTIQIDLKYATTDNFTHEVLYSDLNHAYLHPLALEKLIRAQALLKEENEFLSLLVFDAARPHSTQKKMYEAVKNTPFHLYVANPERTGLHNYGMAVDITICNSKGKELDMGTPFDYFGKEAGINNEENLVREGLLTEQQVNNRKLLRRIMREAGFLTIRGEWWHFNACSLHEAKNTATLIEE